MSELKRIWRLVVIALGAVALVGTAAIVLVPRETLVGTVFLAAGWAFWHLYRRLGRSHHVPDWED